jgi:hypothetical protein
MKETGPRTEQKKFIEVVGNLDLIRRKLKANFGVAFLLSEKDFKVYVSPDNSHGKAAKMAGLPSNNAKEVLIKGRISPKISAFLFSEKGRNTEDFLKGDIDSNLIDTLIPETASALKDWLGEGFGDYTTHYKKSNPNRSPESIA